MKEKLLLWFLPVVNLTRCTISDPKSQNAFTNSVKWCIVFMAFGDMVCKEEVVAWFNVEFPGPPPPPPPPVPECDWEWASKPCGSPWTDDWFEGETPTIWEFFDMFGPDMTIIYQIKDNCKSNKILYETE